MGPFHPNTLGKPADTTPNLLELLFEILPLKLFTRFAQRQLH